MASGYKHLSIGGIDRSVCAKAYGIVYLAKNKLNGKIYIGITRKSLQHRLTNHKSSRLPFGKALRKYGLEGFDISIIGMAENAEALSQLEIFWIKYYDCVQPKGYNLTFGGETTHEKSPETCRKISISKIGNPRPDMKPEDLTGRRFGRLVAIRLASRGPARWDCVCDCGNNHNVDSMQLKHGRCRSCGCLRREIARARKRKYAIYSKKHPLYPAWLSLRRKAHLVCREWVLSFDRFCSDMGERPTGFVLCKRNVFDAYNPHNCYWGTRLEHHGQQMEVRRAKAA